jgi:HAD superfamily hydrolase (TIGR01509 family)
MLFDLWGTLIQHEGPGEDRGRGNLRVERASAALSELGFSYAAAAITKALSCAWDELSRIHADGRDISAEGRTVLFVRHLDPRLGEKLDDSAWYRLHQAVLTAALQARPDAIPGSVEAVRAVKMLGVPAGLISNAGATPGFVLREIMDGYGLLEHFDHTVFSDEVELSKPATAVFEHALDAFGVAAEDAAFVGDQPVLDVLGPQSAGIRAIQVGDLREDGIVPDARIASLDELVPALRKIGLLDGA